jgi:hypothetical protein
MDAKEAHDWMGIKLGNYRSSRFWHAMAAIMCSPRVCVMDSLGALLSLHQSMWPRMTRVL